MGSGARASDLRLTLWKPAAYSKSSRKHWRPRSVAPPSRNASRSRKEDAMETTRLPRINEPAPDFEAKTTHGMLRLSEVTAKGKWVLLFSHPADFTPVCTTEFVEFARRSADFERRNVQLIGNSIDSVYSHIAWVRDIEQKFGVKVTFPVVADLDQKVARKFGMVHEAVSDTAAVRAVFVIDPKQTVRALIYYPLSLGRNIDDRDRIVGALQT